jgi:hypothetical protein
MCQCPDHDIRSKPQRLLTHRLGVAVDFRVIPTVARVRLVGIVDNKPPLVEDAEALSRLPVVLMGFRHAVRKVELAAVEAIAEGELHQILIGEHLPDLASKRFIHAVVIIGVEESAVRKIAAKALDLVVGEGDVAVARQEKERIREKLIAREVDELINRIRVDRRVLSHEFEEVDLFGGVVVPIPAAAVFESCDSKLALNARLGKKDLRRCHHAENTKEENEFLHNENVGKAGQRSNERRTNLLSQLESWQSAGCLTG